MGWVIWSRCAARRGLPVLQAPLVLYGNPARVGGWWPGSPAVAAVSHALATALKSIAFFSDIDGKLPPSKEQVARVPTPTFRRSLGAGPPSSGLRVLMGGGSDLRGLCPHALRDRPQG